MVMSPTDVLTFKLETIVQRSLVEVWQNHGPPGDAPFAAVTVNRSGGKTGKDVVVVVERQADLFEIVLTLCPPGRLTSLLDRWQEKCDEDCDDRDHNQQLNECESS